MADLGGSHYPGNDFLDNMIGKKKLEKEMLNFIKTHTIIPSQQRKRVNQ